VTVLSPNGTVSAAGGSGVAGLFIDHIASTNGTHTIVIDPASTLVGRLDVTIQPIP
jgi:hypothetical protein